MLGQPGSADALVINSNGGTPVDHQGHSVFSLDSVGPSGTPDNNKLEGSPTKKTDTTMSRVEEGVVHVEPGSNDNPSRIVVISPQQQSSASAAILNDTQNDTQKLRINYFKILFNLPFILWAISVGIFFAGLSNPRAAGELGLEALFDSSAFAYNVPLAILIGQRVYKMGEDSMLHFRNGDKAYIALSIAALCLAGAATIPSVPLADDSAQALFPGNPPMAYTVDTINGLNTFLTRVLVAIVLLMLIYTNFFISYCQPNRYFLLQVLNDLNKFPQLHPAGFESINLDFFAALYAPNNDFRQPNIPARSTVIANRIGYGFMIAALGTGPLWYDLTARGAERVFDNVSSPLSAFLSSPSVGFYVHFLRGYPTTFLKFCQELLAHFVAILVAMLALFVTGFAMASGTGLGNEGWLFGFETFNNRTYAMMYSIFCTVAAGAVNQSGVMNLILDTCAEGKRYKDFNLSVGYILLQKFFKCIEVDITSGVYESLEKVYCTTHPALWLQEKNKYDLTHGVHELATSQFLEARGFRGAFFGNKKEERQPSADHPGLNESTRLSNN